jgi:uncharacterized protein YggE
MKGRDVAIVAVVLVVGLATGAGLKIADSHASTQAKDPARLITVSGTATLNTAPDEALVTLGVSSQGATGSDAFAANASKMSSIMKALKQDGVQPSDIQTMNVSLNQRTINRGTPQEQTFFVAQNTVQVTVRELTQVGKIISDAVGAGATNVNNIQFQLSDPTKVEQAALAQAVKGAEVKASSMAKTANASLGGVVTLRETTNYQPYVYHGYDAKLAQSGAGLAPAPISPGNVQTEVTVTATWSLI